MYVFAPYIACEQAPVLEERSKFIGRREGAKRRQRGAKRRGRGACTQVSEFLMSASKFWTQSADWWILIIHDVILVFISGRDKRVLDRPYTDSPMWFVVAMRVIFAFKFWL